MFINSLIIHLCSLRPIAVFLLRNYRASRNLSGCSFKRLKDITLRPFYKQDFKSVDNLYRKYHSGGLPLRLKVLLLLMGQRLCVILESPANKAFGFEIYYFNPRDIEEGTVHQAFTCVNITGKGLGTALRRHSLDYFASHGFRGVSSRVSLSNLPSLKSNMKLGFKVIEQYFDEEMQEERAYLRVELNKTVKKGV